MPYSRRTGRRYTAGSQKKWGGWEPRVCRVCGQRVTLKQDAYHSAMGDRGRPFSVHVGCGGLGPVA